MDSGLDGRVVFVSNLPTKGFPSIEQIFDSAEDIVEVECLFDTGKIYGPCICRFKTPEAARNAVLSSSGKRIEGQLVKMQIVECGKKEAAPRSWNMRIPKTVEATISRPGSTLKNSQIASTFTKLDQSIVYVGLFGPSVDRSKRFSVMNALDNYFRIFGKIRDIGRLKRDYSYLGDFFVVFENEADAVTCSRSHVAEHAHTLVPHPSLKIPTYQMRIW